MEVQKDPACGDKLSSGDYKGLQPHLCSHRRSWNLLALGSQGIPSSPTAFCSCPKEV